MAPRTFTNWKDCCKYLFELIGRNKVLAGENTIIEDTGSGIRVHAQAGGSGSTPTDEYKGYFAIVDISDETGAMIAIADGSYPDAEKCGIYRFGSSGESMDYIEFPVSGTTNFWLEITFDKDSKTCSGEIKSGSGCPNNSTTKDIMLIGTVYVSGGNISAISQVYKGSIYTILNRWTI